MKNRFDVMFRFKNSSSCCGSGRASHWETHKSMNALITFLSKQLLRGWLAAWIIAVFVANISHAGLSVDVHIYHDNDGYYFYPFLSANGESPNFPNGVYQIASPQIPANGSRLVYYATNGVISECYNGDCGGGSYYSTFGAMIYGVTNGL